MALVQVNFFSKSLMRNVTINAIIPADKFDFGGNAVREKKPFKTLYLLHGIFGDYSDWVNGTRIQAWAQERNLAVIMPSGENRFYVDQEASGQMYGQFIGEELVQFTRDLFHLSEKKEDTFIGGLSMGGYGAIRNGLKYSDTFGCIIGLSSGLILENAVYSDNDAPDLIHRRSFYESIFGDLDKLPGSDMDYKALVLKLKREKKDIPHMYLACGTEDFLLEANRDYDRFLKDNGVQTTYVEGPGAHTWEFWDEYILKALNWLPLEEASKGISSGNVQ